VWFLGVGVLSVLLCGLGCADNAETAAPAEPSTEGCALIAADCREMQKGCVGATESEEAFCAPCPIGEYPDGAAQCMPIGGTVRYHSFGTIPLDPGEEIGSVCQSWALNNETELWVNAVELTNNGGYHHSNWFFIPQGKHDYPMEPWYNCYGDGFSEITAALEGGVLYAQSTQVMHDIQKFGDGVAVRIPPYSRIIGATHLLNVYPEPVETELALSIYTIDEKDVAIKLSPFQLTYFDLQIPPQSQSEFSSSCDIDALYQDMLSKPLDLKLHYILPHYHALGTRFDVSVYGGERDGEELFDLGAFTADPFGRVFDPPVDLSGAKGLTFRCGYNNPRDDTVGHGIGDQEMCILLGFAETPLAMDGRAESNTVVGPDEEGVLQNTSSCNMIGFGFSQKKPGGDPLPAASE